MKISRYGQMLKNQIAAFARDESGQSTTEYVLLLLFVVLAVKSVGTKLKENLGRLMDTAFNRANTEAGTPE